MGAAAELHGVALAHVHHADDIAVLLAEQGDGALLLGLLDGQLLGDHIVAGQNSGVDLQRHSRQLLGGHGGEVGEVKAQTVRLHQRTGLVHMVAQHFPQGLVQQMGGTVGTHDGLTALHIQLALHGVADLDLAGLHDALVQELAALVLLHIRDPEHAGAAGDGAVVGGLTAHFRIEGSLVQNHDALFPGLQHAGDLALGDQGQNSAVIFQMVIAGEPGGGVVQTQVQALPGVGHIAPGSAGTLFLLLHQAGEAFLVHGHALLLQDILGQVQGEAVGIIQLEGVLAGEHGLALFLVGLHQLVQDAQAGVNGLGEVLFLHPDDPGDILPLLHQIGISGLVLMDDHVADLVQERFVHAQQLAVAGGPAEQAA